MGSERDSAGEQPASALEIKIPRVVIVVAVALKSDSAVGNAGRTSETKIKPSATVRRVRCDVCRTPADVMKTGDFGTSWPMP